MDGHMFDGLIPALIFVGVIFGASVVGLVWLIVSLI